MEDGPSYRGTRTEQEAYLIWIVQELGNREMLLCIGTNLWLFKQLLSQVPPCHAEPVGITTSYNIIPQLSEFIWILFCQVSGWL